jgi:hypothetical protein
MGVTIPDSPLIYNGINLFIVKTNMFSQRPVYTPDGVDYLYTEFILDINCIYNPAATSYDNSIPPVFDPGATPSFTNAVVRHYLMQKRATLIFRGLEGFANVIASPQTGLAIDANNGPEPMLCDIIRLDGDKTYHIHYVIKTWLIECPNDSLNPILSNRWSQSGFVNEHRYLVRKTVGQAFFRTDILNIVGISADDLRAAIIRPIPPKPGLYRESVRFTINTNNNAIQYEITDIERAYNLGDTIKAETYVTKVDGYFNQGTMSDDPKAGAAVGCTLAEIKVQVWGSFEANNWTLLQVAIQIADRQFPIADIGPAKKSFLRSINCLQSISENYVEFSMAVQVNMDEGLQGAPVAFNPKYLQNVKPIIRQMDPGLTGINPGLQNDQGSRGSEALILLSSALTEACTPQKNPIPNQETDDHSQQPPYGNPPKVIIQTSDILPEIEIQYNPNQQPPYNRSTTKSQYQYDSGAIQAPIANPNNPSYINPDSTTSNNANGPYQCEILNFCAPYSTLHVDWSIERVGIPPDIPHFIRSINCLNNQQQSIIQTAIVNPYSITLSNDLITPIFSVSGSYSYIVPFTPDPANPPMIVFDAPQNLNYLYGDAYIDGVNTSDCGSGQLIGNYIHGIIDSSQGQNQGPGGQGNG